MEQRTSKRIPISLEARLTSGKRTSKAFIVGVSENGLYVIAEPGANERVGNDGWPLTVEFKASSGETLRLPCQVAWSDKHKPGSSLAEMGLVIKDPPPEFRKFYKSSFYKIKTEISHDSIAVIGMSCYYPGAPDPKSLWENILARKRAFRQIPEQRLPLSEYYDPDSSAPDKTYAKRAAVIDGFAFDWVKRGIPKSVVDSSDIVHWLALEVALRALEDAGLSKESIPFDRSGVILGNTLTGEFSRSQQMRLRWPYVKKVFKATASNKLSPAIIDELLDSMEVNYKSAFAPVTEDTLAGNLSNTIAGRICNYLDLHGGGYTVDGACSSSLIAVTTAANALSSGALDLAIAGGIDISLDTFELIGFAKTNALTTDDMRVYDRRANGFIPGEGAGFVVLKRLQDARADGDYIYAVLKGWGVSSDGKGGMTAPKAETQALAIRRAYGKAGYGLGTVDFIEGHGTGTTAGDKAELQGIATAMAGEKDEPVRHCGITSLKSLIGHTKAASGIGGFIKAVMAVNRRVIPPTAGCSDPNPIFVEKARGVYPVLFGEVRNADSTVRAGVSGMGFGGINCHVSVESGAEPAERLKPSIGERELLASYQESEIFVLAAGSELEMLGKITRLKHIAEGISTGEMVDLSRETTHEDFAGKPYRVAVTAGVPDGLIDCLTRLERVIASSDIPEGAVVAGPLQDIWIGNNSASTRVGFLFPGQGSQQLNMARNLVERYPWARKFRDNVETWLAGSGYENVSSHIYRQLDRALDKSQADSWKAELSRPEIAQPAICMASLLWAKYLERLGITPVIAGGHSLGELTAFRQAGAFDDRALFSFAAFRGRVTSAHDGKLGAMAAFACGREKAEEILKEVEGYAVVANVNGPEQTVLSGEMAAMEQAVNAASRLEIKARLLPVGNAFHSRYMAAAAKKIAVCESIPDVIAGTDITLLTSVDGGTVKPGTALRHHFAEQVTHPVDFVSLVNNMRKECDLMVEVGPGRVLSDLARTITGSDGTDCLPVEPRAGDARALNILLGSYFVRGGEVKWDALYENRLVRPFVPASERTFIENPCERLSFHEGEDASRPRCKTSCVQTVPANEPEPHGLEEGPGLLLKLASEMTGFPVDSITLEHRLLDNLNLDSIKAAQFVARAVKLLGAETGKLDPTAMANCSLKEIFGLLEKTASGKTMTGSPAGTAGSGPSEAEAVSHAGNWVRSFKVSYTDQELEPVRTFEQVMDAARAEGRRLLIVTEKGQGAGAEMRGLLLRNGVAVETTDYEGILELRPAGYGGNDFIVFLLPPDKNEGLLTDTEVRRMAARLHCIASVITSLRTQETRPAYAAVQFGGGGLHAPGPGLSVEAKGSTAFLCSVHLENPAEMMRVLEFARPDDMHGIVWKLCEELHTGVPFSIASYDERLRRRVPVLELLGPDSYRKRDIAWSADDVVLVTGGAKGITAECALQFAKTKGVKLALVGSTALTQKDEEAQRTLARYRDNGVTCRYYACDVSDRQGVSDLIKKVERDLGKVAGVIHGAALNRARRVEQASLDEACSEVAPKLLGAINILEALKDSPLKLFAAFGSVIGVTGMAGNAWYAFANETMNLLLKRYKEKTGTEVVTPAFSVWSGAGMGSRKGTISFLSGLGILPIPVDKGVARFMELIDSEPPEEQIIVASRLGTLDSIGRPATARPAGMRFLEETLAFEKGVEVESKAVLSLEKDPYLEDHVFKGVHLFPAVFGLEAMAQAVSAVTGVTEFGWLRLEDVRLPRPITVEPGGTTEIRVRALVSDTPDKDGGMRVHAGITVDQTLFSRNHFEATFVIGLNKGAEKFKGRIPRAALDIRPEEDLYGHMLFQGSSFQRIKAVRSIGPKRCVFDSALEAGPFVTRDPYFRDTLLQSVQIILPDLVALPVEIEKWEIFPGRSGDGDRTVVADLLDRGEEFVTGSVTAVDTDGMVVERLQGYKAKVLERLQDAPTPLDLASPDNWDERLIEETLHTYCEAAGLVPPTVSLRHRSGLHEMARPKRRALEKELFAGAYERLRADDEEGIPDKVTVAWTKEGKPFARESYAVGLSCSHDDRACLAAAGRGSLGCDIEPITGRNMEDWKALLGPERAPLLEEVAALDSSPDMAGSRIWCALEAVRKATGKKEDGLRYVRSADDCVLFEGCGMTVLTFPVMLLRGRRRMVAVAASKRAVPGRVMEDARNRAVEQGSFTHRFPLGLKDSATVAGGVYFASYFNWLGKMREMALKPIGRYIADEFHHGHFMATNFTETDIYAHVGNHETIDSRVWIEKAPGGGDSSLVLCFDWGKPSADGSIKRVASSRQRVSWIKVIDHGIVEPVPVPGFFMDFLRDSNFLPGEGDKLPAGWALNGSRTYERMLGKVLHERDVLGESNGVLLDSFIDTTMEHSNLAQNVYFSNYFTWQGHLRDRYLFSLSPEHYRTMDAHGQFACIHSQVEHLREAMPFDRVHVKMKLSRLFERGIELYFEYFKAGPEGKKQKLAYGVHALAWVSIDGSDDYITRKLPAVYTRQILNTADRTHAIYPRERRY